MRTYGRKQSLQLGFRNRLDYAGYTQLTRSSVCALLLSRRIRNEHNEAQAGLGFTTSQRKSGLRSALMKSQRKSSPRWNYGPPAYTARNKIAE